MKYRLAGLMAAVLMAGSAHATVTNTWIGDGAGGAGDGNWNTAGNWTGGVPVDQHAVTANLNGNILIIFNADGPTLNVPTLESSNKSTDGTSDLPRVQVNQGTVSITADNTAFWKKSNLATNPSKHMIQVGDGVNAASLTYEGTGSVIEFARFDQNKGEGPYTATVEANATLTIPDKVALTQKDTNGDMQFTVKTGGALISGALSVDPMDVGTGESFIELESGATYTFDSGTAPYLSSAAEVETYFGTVLRGVGTTLSVTDNGGTFTVIGQAAELPGQVVYIAPADAATSVDVDTDLTWSSATYALTYDVYFGPTGSMTQTTNTTAISFDPGTMAYGGSNYQWRVDSVNGEGTTTGPVWSFTTEPVPPEPGKTSNLYPADGATGIIVTTNLSWTAATDAKWYNVYYGLTTTNMTQVSTNQTETVYDPNMLYETNYQWRVDAINVSGVATGDVWTFSTEDAPPPPEQVTNPSPADGAVDQDVDTDLAWSAAAHAVSYKGSYWVVGSGSTNGFTTTETSNALNRLPWGTDYEWRIDSVNGSGTTTGQVWSFSVEDVPVYTWTSATDGDWDNAGNWDANGVPVDQNVGQTGLNGNMYIVFDGTTAPAVNVPLLAGQNSDDRATPKLQVNQGTITLPIHQDGFWERDQGEVTVMTVGNGTDAATLNLEPTGALKLGRAASGPLKTVINNNGLLKIDNGNDILWSENSGIDFQVTIKSGGECQLGEVRKTPFGFDGNFVAMESEAKLLINQSASTDDLDTVEAVESFYGTSLIGLNGATLSTVLSNGYLVVTASGGYTPYEAWLEEWGLIGADTNMTANPDGDNLLNIYEYGLGGNPNADVDSALLPTYTLLEDSGTNWMEYVYRRRTDYVERDLSYYLELKDNLVTGTWANEGYQGETAVLPIDEDFESVVNRVPTEDSATFIRLIIK